MKDRDLAVLKKILKEIECLARHTADCKTYEDFMSDDKTQRASVMTLINIGELTTHLSEEFKKSHTNIPFGAIKGLRNVAAHGYLTLNFKLIWSTIQESIPDLKLKIEKIIPKH